ncbi:uncharacterized protein [Cherax quadricarinatus]|uniref:uncharacterized protein n=1 Tax=Cherax quadricarinatus TaxID=27406 RepID=UPI002379BB3C|nr:uncharacterized protein LOC128686015 [Cherax quadricarinatus]
MILACSVFYSNLVLKYIRLIPFMRVQSRHMLASGSSHPVKDCRLPTTSYTCSPVHTTPMSYTCPPPVVVKVHFKKHVRDNPVLAAAVQEADEARLARLQQRQQQPVECCYKISPTLHDALFPQSLPSPGLEQRLAPSRCTRASTSESKEPSQDGTIPHDSTPSVGETSSQKNGHNGWMEFIRRVLRTFIPFCKEVVDS